jgi:RHS repeat-associated protein
VQNVRPAATQQAKAVPPPTASKSGSEPAVPALSLPKGGGAIRGIGEKFSVNPVSGTGKFSLPLVASPGRAGFGPQLTLEYDSGSGNGPFGFGWQAHLATITRKTDKGLPKYIDAEESDVFILAGAEDLVPILDDQRRRVRTARVVHGIQYEIHPYRPRIEGLFSRIERWKSAATGLSHWRTISRDNVTALYGIDANSRISSPDGKRVFSYLVSRTFDDKGNIIVYEYAAEDDVAVSTLRLAETNRLSSERATNRYPKYIRYGNTQPYFADYSESSAEPPLPSAWHFMVVFDYGDHDPDIPSSRASVPRSVRPDPFSSRRAGFEVRTYRRCRRVLSFHDFPLENGVGADCLVQSTDLVYSDEKEGTDLTKPVYSILRAVSQSGYRREAAGYVKRSLPPVEFEYSRVKVHAEVETLDLASADNLPVGLHGGHLQWIDLDGEGLASPLLDLGGHCWLRKPNLSPLEQFERSDGTTHTQARFGQLEEIVSLPSRADLKGQQLLDLSGDGELDVVSFAHSPVGFFERSEESSWLPFRSFASLPNLDWSNPDLKLIDLTGDGLADILLTEEEVFTVHESLGAAGFGTARTILIGHDEERWPRMVSFDETENIVLADMSGDGLKDIVRVRNGQVSYWPNLGYGAFGAKITMERSPWLARDGEFDPARVRLADIDGSGTTDLLYIGADGVTVWFNQSGDGWSTAHRLAVFPSADALSSVQTFDLLGNGTTCLVWSSVLPGVPGTAVRYVDLMGGDKPHLLTHARNNMGAETRLGYAPSTRFYLADKLAGRPWVTHLPYVVHVVERVESYDWVSRNRFVTRYAYHHGHFDGTEREFRGFGMVERWDTEELDVLREPGRFPPATNIDSASFSPPVLVKTWFHTGVFAQQELVSRTFQHEYYSEQPEARSSLEHAGIRLPDSRLPAGLSGDDSQEAVRTLKGMVLRQETYALDGSPGQNRPFSISEHNYGIRLIQPRAQNRHGVFLSHARESLDAHYERALYDVGGHKRPDPRVQHHLVLAVDDHGNVLHEATVAYGRRYPEPTLNPRDQAIQQRPLITTAQHTYTHAIAGLDTNVMPRLAESVSYEIIQVASEDQASEQGYLFEHAALNAKLALADDGLHDLSCEDIDARGAVDSGHPYRRVIDRSRTLFRKDDLSGPLPLGEIESHAIAYQTLSLALTPGLLGLFQRDQQNLLPDVLGALQEGGYVSGDSLQSSGLFPSNDASGLWWHTSGTAYFSSDARGADMELAYARQHFFTLRRFRDAFGNESTADYDPYDLLLLQTRDALGNVTTAGERNPDGGVRNANDYRVLHPTLLCDPNGNFSLASFDVLGMVVGGAERGKAQESVGDSLSGFVPDLSPSQIEEVVNQPAGRAATALLANATTRFVYDPWHFMRHGRPLVAVGIRRETHVSDLALGQTSRLAVDVSYADGLGREIQRKTQTEPGPLKEGVPPASPRWIGSGWTIFNNKGNPLRRYEPFFTATHEYEARRTEGMSSISLYDALQRVVATIHPDHSYEKVVLDPWKHATWDANDTALIADPRTDPDVGVYFKRLDSAEFLPSWHQQRVSGALGEDAKAAALMTEAHAGTPDESHVDPLGRVFLTVLLHRVRRDGTVAESRIETRTRLDIQDNEVGLTDALGRLVKRTEHDLLGNVLVLWTMDAGTHWALLDIHGAPLRTWNSLRHDRRTSYDALRRPLKVYLRHAAGEAIIEQVEYGEGQPDPERNNLRGRPYRVSDGAVVTTSEQYDFKGHVLTTVQRLVRNYRELTDWSRTVELETQSYSFRHAYDAMDRPVSATLPDQTVVKPTYSESGQVVKIEAQLRGRQQSQSFVDRMEYNARGQRTAIAYGNGVRTRYEYDPETLRLTAIATERSRALFPADCPANSGPCGLQKFRYTYDAVGNVTHIDDQAQPVVYFRNQVVAAKSVYTYDSIYRLVEATGREHLGQAAQGANPQLGWQLSVPHPNDGRAMGRYRERFTYDLVDNLLEWIHGNDAIGLAGWTRSFSYAEPSQLESGKVNNRLTVTHAADIDLSRLTYDAHGNVISMSQHPVLVWDHQDRLQSVSRQVVNSGTPGTTYFRYDASGRRVRKVTESANGAGGAGRRLNERIYLGPFEIYREYSGDGRGVTLERESVHILDEQQTVALVETRTQGSDPTLAQLIRYRLTNHQGSVTHELDSEARILSYEEYYAYGGTSYRGVDSAVEASRGRYRYCSKELDDETGFSYYGARYYAAWLGRWTAADPAGTVDGPNVYAFVRGNPVSLVDAKGTQAGPYQSYVGGQQAAAAAKSLSNDVGAPGFAESLIPIWGSGREAVHDFQTGHWGWGLVNTGLAISDVFLVKSLVTAGGKLVIKGGAKLLAKEGAELAAKEGADLTAKELAEKEAAEAVKQQALKETAAKEAAAKEAAAKEAAAKEAAQKEAAEKAAKEAAAREAAEKEAAEKVAKESAAKKAAAKKAAAGKAASQTAKQGGKQAAKQAEKQGAKQAAKNSKFSWGKYLRSKIGGAPKGMVKPHAHHILFKEGIGAEQKRLVAEGQAMLREAGIDPIKGVENLTWAPNIAGQHLTSTLKKLVDMLKELKAAGATREEFVKALRAAGQRAASLK